MYFELLQLFESKNYIIEVFFAKFVALYISKNGISSSVKIRPFECVLEGLSSYTKNYPPNLPPYAK